MDHRLVIDPEGIDPKIVAAVTKDLCDLLLSEIVQPREVPIEKVVPANGQAELLCKRAAFGFKLTLEQGQKRIDCVHRGSLLTPFQRYWASTLERDWAPCCVKFLCGTFRNTVCVQAERDGPEGQGCSTLIERLCMRG